MRFGSMETVIRPALALLALAALGCGGVESTGDPEPARLRVVHGIRDVATVDLTVDGATLATGIPYGGSAPADAALDFRLQPGAHTISLVSAGTTLVTLPSFVVRTDDVVTIVGAGSATGTGDEAPRTIGATDDRRNLAPDRSELRIVHAATRLPSLVDVYLTRVDGASDISLLAPTAAGLGRYTGLGPFRGNRSDFRVRVTEPGTKTVLADGTITLRNGFNVLTLLDDATTPVLKFAVTGQ